MRASRLCVEMDVTKVLLVDDDPDLLDLLTYGLGREGYEVLTAADGQQGLARWRADRPDIVLLDRMMPRLDGLEVCRQIRQESDTPVIMLTVRDDEADVVHGLQVGADDYVPKPFSAKQLVARMQAILRRTRRDRFQQPAREIRVGELRLDLEANCVTRGGRSVGLTRLEFRILETLALNAGKVVPHARLVERVWGNFDESTSKVLKTHVTHIRRKLGLPADGPGGIRAVRDVGYVLVRSAAPPVRGVKRGTEEPEQ